MAYLSKYGVARKIRIPLVKRGVVDHAVSADWTPAAGDVKISKDGGATANVTNLPTAIAMGNSAIWEFSLTATEMQAAQINVTIADSATKAVEDNGFDIETYGNASGQHAFDLGTATQAVTVTTNNDKTGYSLSQTFPANFSSLAITAGGAVTAGTVSDKTGYSLTQTFPANFSSLAITAGGAVTAGTVSDKTGYSLTQSFPANFASLAITVGGAVTAGTVSDKTGYALTAAYDLAKTAAQAGDAMALTVAERNSTADALLARNVGGGSSAGRLVKEALYVLRNKVDVQAGTMTVYGTDDVTSAFTATVTTAAGNPITTIDPA